MYRLCRKWIDSADISLVSVCKCVVSIYKFLDLADNCVDSAEKYVNSAEKCVDYVDKC